MDSKDIAIQINVTRSFKEGSGVTWQTSMPQTAALKEIDTISDKVMQAIQRQEVWSRIDAMNDEIETYTRQRAQIMFGIKNLEDKHGDFSRAKIEIKQGYEQNKESLVRITTLIAALIEEQKRLARVLDEER